MYRTAILCVGHVRWRKFQFSSGAVYIYVCGGFARVWRAGRSGTRRQYKHTRGGGQHKLMRRGQLSYIATRATTAQNQPRPIHTTADHDVSGGFFFREEALASPTLEKQRVSVTLRQTGTQSQGHPHTPRAKGRRGRTKQHITERLVTELESGCLGSGAAHRPVPAVPTQADLSQQRERYV
jgi:hypothetical protein